VKRDLSKRPLDLKRDPYIHGQRPIYTWKETHVYKKRGRSKRPAKETLIYEKKHMKETYIHEKRPMNLK